MTQMVAVVGAGVSGLTCAVVFAERGHRTAILAEKIGPGTTSSAAAAVWYPYDTGPSAGRSRGRWKRTAPCLISRTIPGAAFR